MTGSESFPPKPYGSSGEAELTPADARDAFLIEQIQWGYSPSSSPVTPDMLGLCGIEYGTDATHADNQDLVDGNADESRQV